jgi:hypothetical protein
MIMKANPVIKTLICILLFTAFSTSLQSQNQEREFYQLKIYTLENENQENLVDAYLENAYLPALRRMGIQNIGVFKLRPNKYTLSNKIFVLIPFSTMGGINSLEAKLEKDKIYQSAGKDYLKAPYEQPPYARINTTLLLAFEDMPKMSTSKVKGPRKDRIYELRSYESHTERIFKNKVDMFNAGGEVKLFEELGFNAVFYAEVLSGDKMPNLMYMTTFENQESRDKHWDSFRIAPKWKQISSQAKYQNNVSHIDRFFLYPTEYSDY